jgi:hypothetical protein
VADCNDFVDNPVNFTFCGEHALNGTEGKQAIVCETYASTICESCYDSNSDPNKY